MADLDRPTRLLVDTMYEIHQRNSEQFYVRFRTRHVILECQWKCVRSSPHNHLEAMVMERQLLGLGSLLRHAQDGTAPTRLATMRSSHIPLFSPRSCSHPFPTDQLATAGGILSKVLSWVKMA